MPAAIVTDQLTRVFREPPRLFRRSTVPATVALDRLSFQVETGECVALVGPNGAGKSTLLRVLSTAVLPTSGTARILEHDVAVDASDVRRLVGVMVGDDRSFFWRLSGLENLIFFAELQGLTTTVAKRRASELLDALDLTSAATRRFSGYSTGMRQRLGIARALLHRPPILLFDEPTANLDLEHRGHVIEILRTMLGSGSTTALIASHDAGLAVTLANRSIRLEHGRLGALDTRRDPQHYRLRVRGLTDEQLQALSIPVGSDIVPIDDLGDGHALAATIAAIVSGGGEIVSVDQVHHPECDQ